MDNYDKDFMITITCNLLNNLVLRSNFIRNKLRYYKSQKHEVDDTLKLAVGLYVCSLGSCWETFIRDLFILICNSDMCIHHRYGYFE